MELLVVRHAHAGTKDRWRGDDQLRPLSERGWEEALGLVRMLSHYEPSRVLSSPLVRCVQTVEPLAKHLGLQIEETDALRPQGDREAARLLRKLSSSRVAVVVCTHGETIEALQRRLDGPGKFAFRPGGPHEKGSVWLLEGKGGRFKSARYVPPRKEHSSSGTSVQDEAAAEPLSR